MAIFLCAILFLGDTVKLSNGEIFQGMIIRKSKKKVWLKLDKGGVLVFEKLNLLSINDVPLKSSDQKINSEVKVVSSTDTDKKPAGSQEKNNLESSKNPVDNSLKNNLGSDEADKTTPGKNKIMLKKYPKGIYLKCPVGFKEDKQGNAPPYVIIYREKGTDAVISLRVEPFSRGFTEAISFVRKEIGKRLNAERVFKFKNMDLESRLFEWEKEKNNGHSSCMTLVMVSSRTLYRITASVKTDYFPGYRAIYYDVFENFSIPLPDKQDPSPTKTNNKPLRGPASKK